MFCWYCGKVKGKRICPAHGDDYICSRCCGTKRRTEIRCPKDCAYSFGEQDPRWDPTSRQVEKANFIAHFAGVKREQVHLLLFLHNLLIQTDQEAAGGLSDKDLLDVVNTLHRTFETFSKGIVYEHKTESPQLEMVTRKLKSLLDKRQEIPNGPRASDTEVTNMLQTIATAINAHQEQSSGDRSYLDMAGNIFKSSLSQISPTGESNEQEGEPDQNKLIIEP